jgi:hypothetical protein
VANKIVINEVALNESGFLPLSGAGTFAASAVILASLTYVQVTYSESMSAVADISSDTIQEHNFLSQPVSPTSAFAVSPNPIVQKPLETNASALATLDSSVKPPDGGALFDASASIAAVSTNFISPLESAPATATGGFTLTAAPFITHKAESSFDDLIYPQEYSSFFGANESIKLNGETEYTHYATADPNYYSFSTLTIPAGQIRVYSDAWLPNGTILFDADITYAWTAYAAFSMDATIAAFAGFDFFDSPNLSATATITDGSVKTSVAASSMSAPATMPAVKSDLTIDAKKTLSGVGNFVFTSAPIILADGGYVYKTATATLDLTSSFISRTATVNMKPKATVSPTSFQWTIHQGESDMSAPGDVFAFPSIWGYDIFVVERVPDVKDFVRAPDVKDFKKV